MNIVVIGSGLGGLTTAAFLAKDGHKVTVLEQHYRIGGYAHNFKRKSYIFESGIHTVPLSDNGVVMGILSQLGVKDKIETIEYPEMYRSILPSGKEYIIPAKEDEIKEFFYTTFPEEKEGLDKYFSDMRGFKDNIFNLFTEDKRGFRDENQEFMKPFRGRSYQTYLRNYFTNEDLLYIFESHWPFIGITANRAANVFMEVLFATHFYEGSFAVKNGFAQIAEALKTVIEDNGGEVKIKSKVTAIECNNKKATSVITENGDTYDCDILVSNISPQLIQNNLLRNECQGRRWKRKLNELNNSLSAVIIHIGMKDGYENILKGNIISWNKYKEIGKIYDRIIDGKPYNQDHLLVLNSIDSPTVILLTMADQKSSNNWKEQKGKDSQLMLEKFEELYPGISDYIDYKEVGSPNTFERFTSNFGGAIYGFENSSEPYREGKYPIKTNLTNMYQTGHWGIPGCGVFNVIANGFTVSKLILEEINEQ